jgi:hypothetical protein
MAYVPTAADLTDLKKLLGITTEDEDNILNFMLKLTGTKAMNSMNQTEMPDEFQPVLIEMTADTYRLLQSANGDQEQTVSSVTDKDQTVSYRDSSFDKVLLALSQSLKNYEMQLERFRKVGW